YGEDSQAGSEERNTEEDWKITKRPQRDQEFEIRRKRYLEEIVPYTKKNLFKIYRLDNEKITYN
ncbi:hypothetical protein MBANPS3_011833, partial [Mucor bainieri]